MTAAILKICAFPVPAVPALLFAVSNPVTTKAVAYPKMVVVVVVDSTNEKPTANGSDSSVAFLAVGLEAVGSFGVSRWAILRFLSCLLALSVCLQKKSLIARVLFHRC